MIVSIWASPFSGALAVSFREGIVFQNYSNTWWGGVKGTLESRTWWGVWKSKRLLTKCLDVWGSIQRRNLKNMVVFIEHLALLNESITWLLYNAKQEQYEQVIGGIPKLISQTPCLWVHLWVPCVPRSNKAAPRSVPTKHCVATNCVFKY